MNKHIKTLILIRHAKSEWGNPFLSDFDRPLNARGKKNALRMGEVLSRRKIHPDLILSSPALRAKTTAIEISDKLSYPADSIRYEPLLYASEIERIFSVIRAISKDINTLLVFGHNPEFTECANALCKCEIDNIPTCGVVAMQLNVDSWENIGFNSAKLLFFDTPKQQKDKTLS